jgi:hypothetical protein
VLGFRFLGGASSEESGQEDALAGYRQATFARAAAPCWGADGAVPGSEDSTLTIRLSASGIVTAIESTLRRGPRRGRGAGPFTPPTQTVARVSRVLRRLAAAAACASLLALGLSACGSGGGSGDGSSNGITDKSANDIAVAATSAVENASSVHVSGPIARQGFPTALDLTLVNGKGAQGSMSAGPLNFQIVAVDREIYINGSPSFWRRYANNNVARLLSGRWLKAPAGGQFAGLAVLADMHSLFNQLLAHHGKLVKGEQTTVRGNKVIGLKDASDGGTLYVATTGRPYPIQVIKRGSQGGELDFDRYNQPVSIKAPGNAIDVSQLK